MILFEKFKSFFSAGDGGLIFANITNIFAALNSADFHQFVFFCLSIITTIFAIYSKYRNMKVEKVEQELNNRKIEAEIKKIEAEINSINKKD